LAFTKLCLNSARLSFSISFLTFMLYLSPGVPSDPMLYPLHLPR
jgi:hypothetical protein